MLLTSLQRSGTQHTRHTDEATSGSPHSTDWGPVGTSWPTSRRAMCCLTQQPGSAKYLHPVERVAPKRQAQCHNLQQIAARFSCLEQCKYWNVTAMQHQCINTNIATVCVLVCWHSWHETVRRAKQITNCKRVTDPQRPEEGPWNRAKSQIYVYHNSGTQLASLHAAICVGKGK